MTALGAVLIAMTGAVVVGLRARPAHGVRPVTETFVDGLFVLLVVVAVYSVVAVTGALA